MLGYVVRSIASLISTLIQSRITGIAGIIAIATGVVVFTSTTEPPSLHAAAVQGGKSIDAPDLVGGTDWLNTDKPINLAQLRGRIVLLDFWTLCCINCIHTLPDLAKLEARYPGVLVVIGIHSPKFENEKKTASVLKAVLRYEIKHPVINDADRKLWNAYGVNHWPTLVLIDPDGKVRGIAKGEGNYAVAERDIKLLIKEYTAKGTLKKDPIAFQLSDEKPAPLCFPGRVLADAKSKRLFIADSTNHRIVITDLDGKKLAIAGSGKEGLKDGPYADAQFSDPQGMCLDGDTLYVADRKNHAIRALDLKKETVKRVAGTGENNPAWFGKPGTSNPARTYRLSSPWDVLLVNKRIYIAMAGRNQIWIFDPAKETVGAYAGTGYEEIVDGTLAKSCFAQPSGLATDGKRLYVADCETSSIRSVPLLGDTGSVTTVVGKGLFDFGDVDGVGPQVRLQHALAVVHHDGKLYVADTYNNKIKVLDPAKRNCYTYAGGEKELDEPGGLSIAAGKLYVADTNNHRIQVIDMKSRDITTLNLQGVDPIRRATSVGVPQKK
ncbi:MAG: redoxin domain-containing protein [Planctomycetes bacterium]|nr:redoxin domain-containing protein [Planctomycetota bacterium]